MANQLYTKAKDAILKGEIDFSTDTIKAVLVDTADYVSDTATDDFLDLIVAGARVGTPQTITGMTVVDGVVSGDNITFTGVTGDEAEALVIYKDSGVEATSQLIAYIDTASYLPVTPNTGDIIVEWNSGAGEILTI